MKIKLAACTCIALASAASASPRALAHDHALWHSHLGGAIPPDYVGISMVRFHDVVYDESAPDSHLTNLDIYLPDPVAPGSPVMVFVHGGGLHVGDKAHAKDLDPKPEWFTHRLGFIFISINYRLLPEGRYPTNVQDVANALVWVHDHIEAFGGDPDQIFLMGHSAGATLVSQVATTERFLRNAGRSLALLKGVIPIDGSNFDFTRHAASAEGRASRRDAYGPDWEAASAVANVGPGKNIPPFLILHVAGGTKRNYGVDSEEQALSLAASLHASNVPVRVIPLPGKEHFTANEAIGEPGDLSTIAVRQFLESLTTVRPRAAR